MDNKVGEFIRDNRKELGVTLRELAKETGISFSHLSKIERGEHMPTKETIETIADSLRVDKYELFLLAGHSTDSDMEFWRELFNNLNPEWGIDKSEFVDKNGNSDILKFRNYMVHENFDKEIYKKLNKYFFTERFIDSITKELRPSLNELVKVPEPVFEELTEEESEWYEFYEEMLRRNYTPRKLLHMIDTYEEMEKKILHNRKIDRED